MPAYFDTGFSVREPMWHGGGLVLSEYPEDWNDARTKAGLLWEPEARPAWQLPTTVECSGCGHALGTAHAETCVAMLSSLGVIRGEDGEVKGALDITDAPHLVTPQDVDAAALVSGIRPLKDHKLIVRNDTELVLGVVGDSYELLNHSEMGSILEAVLGLDNVKFETAGSCRDGAQVWALAYIDEPYKVLGDDSESYPFLALLNNHDGTGACKLVATQVRVVCWNSYRAAEMEGERSGRQFTFRHTAGIHDRIEEAKQALAGVRTETEEWTELAAALFGMKADEAAFNHFLADFIPDPVGDVVSDRVRNNVEKARSIFKSLYLDSPTGEAHRGTALGLIDASVEYLDHVRGYRNSDTYMGRTLLRPEPLKAKATMLARAVCTV